MAIYHLTVKTISKGSNSSALSRYDYIERIQKYAYDSNEVMSCAYGNMPEWAHENEREYWKSADSYERQNGRLCKQIEFSIPRELSPGAQIDLAINFVESIASTKDGPLPYSLAVHRGKGTNPHCHVLISERVNDGLARTPETWFKRAGKTPEVGGARKTEALKPQEWLYSIREEWSRQANQALERAGHEERIDHRTLAQQGIDREPTYHLGPMLTRMERAGKSTRIGEINRHIRDIEELKTQSAVLDMDNQHEEQSREFKGMQAVTDAFIAKIKERERVMREERERIAKIVPLKERIATLSQKGVEDYEAMERKYWDLLNAQDDNSDFKKIVKFVSQYDIYGITNYIVKVRDYKFIEKEKFACSKSCDEFEEAKNDFEHYEKNEFKIIKIFSNKRKELKDEFDKKQETYNIAKKELENKELCRYYMEELYKAFLNSKEYKDYKKRQDVRGEEIRELKKVERTFFDLAKGFTTNEKEKEKLANELIKKWEQAKPEQQEEILKNAEKTVAQAKGLARGQGIPH